jgi:predicted dehydrogenase
MSWNLGLQMKRFLVMGCGSIGTRHIDNLLALEAGQVYAVDPLEAKRAEAEGRFGIRTFSDVEEALSLRPDVALIATPTSSHVELALEAAKRGCHLFIEKPLSHDLESTGELIKCVGDAGLVSLVGCNMRFHPGLRTVKQLLDQGIAGRVIAILVHFGHYLPDWHPKEDYRSSYSARSELGGGIILDAIHEIDYARWLLGEVKSVACLSGKLTGLDIDTEDTAAMLLSFADGAIGEIHVDYVQRAYSRKCEVLGDEGTIRWDYVAGEVRVFRSGSNEWQVLSQPAEWSPNDMYVDEMRHFLRCLSREEAPALDVSEAACVLRIALAAKSAAGRGEVVELR